MWKQQELNVAHEAIAECVTMFSSHFNVICDLCPSITEQTHGNLESLCFMTEGNQKNFYEVIYASFLQDK